jgi:uncharacterized membrane protein YphA (DoxX/SURF4 family)
MPVSIDEQSVTIRDHPAQLCLVTGDERVARARRPPARGRPRPRPRTLERLHAIELGVHRWLVAHSLVLLRISLGAVFLGFGLLKFFPGISPAENMVTTTTSILTFHLVPSSIALVAVASLECVVGLLLLSGRWLRGAIHLLAVELVGILSPLVLLPARLFGGPHHAPTLEGQYVIKDVILVAAVLVVATAARGARLTCDDDTAGRVGRAPRPEQDAPPPLVAAEAS